jgi:hypothetical protein
MTANHYTVVGLAQAEAVGDGKVRMTFPVKLMTQ